MIRTAATLAGYGFFQSRLQIPERRISASGTPTAQPSQMSPLNWVTENPVPQAIAMATPGHSPGPHAQLVWSQLDRSPVGLGGVACITDGSLEGAGSFQKNENGEGQTSLSMNRSVSNMAF